MSRTHDVLGLIAERLPRLSQSGGRQGMATSRHTPGPRVPVAITALSLATEIHGDLVAWVRIAHDRGIVHGDDWPHDTTQDLCTWLQVQADTLDALDIGSEWQANLENLWARLQALTTPPRPQRPACPTCGATMTCHDGEGVNSDDPAAWRWSSCPACGQSWTYDAGLQRLGQLQTLSLPQWAEEAGIHERTLRRRVRAVDLRPCGRVGSNPVYRREDLVRLALLT